MKRAVEKLLMNLPINTLITLFLRENEKNLKGEKFFLRRVLLDVLKLKLEREICDIFDRKKKFILIAGTGHCGTKWLAYCLNRPFDNMVFFHELKMTILNKEWLEIAPYQFEKGITEVFNPYFNLISLLMRRFKIVGDSNSWELCFIPEVHKKMKINYIIYLVRNGIQCVHSQYYINKEFPRSHWLYETFIKKYYKMLQSSKDDWNTYDEWACWCFYWKINKYMPQWLKEHLNVEVFIYRFEDLLKDTKKLKSLFLKINSNISISENELKSLQLIDINRKIKGHREPEFLWKKWTQYQRDVFLKICGETMEYYNYEIPKNESFNSDSFT